jgi:hypothetical protein
MKNIMVGTAEKMAINFQNENKETDEISSNMGVSDSLLRMILGAIILFSMYLGHLGTIGWFGAVPLAMGFVSWCPFYSILGFSTCKTKREEEPEYQATPEERLLRRNRAFDDVMKTLNKDENRADDESSSDKSSE